MQQTGYTLIELLLVIAVLAILSSLAIMTYRSNAENNRVDQAALEMQHVLQAALAFNVAKNNWPDKNDQTPNCTPNSSNQEFIQNFLPNANFVSNYGNNFCWATDAISKEKTLFWVALKMPFSDSARNYQTATQIAARLPAAVLLTDLKKGVSPDNLCTTASTNCYVRAEVTIPAAQGNNGNGEVVGLGYCDPNATVSPQVGSRPDVTCVLGDPKDHYTINFSCPQGELGQLYLMPNFYRAAGLGEHGAPTVLTTLSASTITEEKTAKNTCYKNPTSSEFICPIVITALYDNVSYAVTHPDDPDVEVSPGAIGVTYIAYCVKPSTSFSENITRW